jgi:ribonuclease P protein component
VRRLGKSHAHPLIVLISHPNELKISRFGVLAGRSIGNAVKRNRSKRLIREAIKPLINTIPPGWDIIFLARKPSSSTEYNEISIAVHHLLEKSEILK